MRAAIVYLLLTAYVCVIDAVVYLCRAGEAGLILTRHRLERLADRSISSESTDPALEM